MHSEVPSFQPLLRPCTQQMVQICEFQVFELSNVSCHESNQFRVCILFSAGNAHLPPKSCLLREVRQMEHQDEVLCV